ncbi:MAG: HEPN domain-containing protein [Actinomycetota bacterium]|nr:HEPN domain-containing protein [Actinomycetota bacterium]
MTRRDLAETLLRKATEDLEALRVLAVASTVADWVVGFHAQQAVEKAVKAVVTAAGLRAGKTHDLEELLAPVGDARIDVPQWLAATADLQQFAVIGRYVELPLDEPFDRDATVGLVERSLGWAAERVAEAATA